MIKLWLDRAKIDDWTCSMAAVRVVLGVQLGNRRRWIGRQFPLIELVDEIKG